MPQIELSELAPEGATSFALANSNLTVPCESTDPVILANAKAHPWLVVKYEEANTVAGTYVDTQIKPEDDALSAVNSVANDPDAVRAANAEREVAPVVPLAVDASLDQGKESVIGEGDHQIAETLASDDIFTDNKPSRSRRSGKEN